MTKREECIEAMARAMSSKRHAHLGGPDADTLIGRRPNWHFCVPDAEIALDAALRVLGEPDAEMVEAGAIAASRNDMFERVDDVTPYAETDASFRAEWRAEVEAAYRAMLATVEKSA